MSSTSLRLLPVLAPFADETDALLTDALLTDDLLCVDTLEGCCLGTAALEKLTRRESLGSAAVPVATSGGLLFAAAFGVLLGVLSGEDLLKLLRDCDCLAAGEFFARIASRCALESESGVDEVSDPSPLSERTSDKPLGGTDVIPMDGRGAATAAPSLELAATTGTSGGATRSVSLFVLPPLVVSLSLGGLSAAALSL